MVTSLPKPAVVRQAALRETLLTPRFYTTDFGAAAAMDLSTQAVELETMLAEMRADYNARHFVRNESFAADWAQITGDTRQAFLDYLERSCVSEFSGFLLFKELSRRIKDQSPVLAEIFQLMARDEARHAGFLNKAMGDFGRTLDLGFLTKNRQYTFFPIEWVIYSVYLSEKIGYWRYILIHRHLEQHPDRRFYPLFNYFEPWCQDENRHGDIFKVLLRSQPKLWATWRSRLWSRFFLLTVFATHTLTVHERAGFYRSLGIDPTAFDAEVIRKTNETAARAFPEILDLERPEFLGRLHACAELNLKLSAIGQSQGPSWWKSFRKLPLLAAILGHLWVLYWLPGIDAEAQRQAVS